MTTASLCAGFHGTTLFSPPLINMADSTTNSDTTGSVRSSWHSHTHSISSQSSTPDSTSTKIEDEKSVDVTIRANSQDNNQEIDRLHDRSEADSDAFQPSCDHIDWIYGKTYTKVEVDGQSWCILQRLSEEKSQWNGDTCISRAVYVCVPWSDRCDSKVAVMKIYMQ